MKQKHLLMALATITSGTAFSGVEDLLLSELKVGPTAGEFIEIFNKGDEVVSLNGVYITDATNTNSGCSSNPPSNGINQFYYNLPSGFNFGGAQFSEQEFDFHAKFPENDTIGPGERITIAMAGAANFNNTDPDVGGGFTEIPAYEMIDTNGVPNMVEVVPGSIGDGDSTYNSPTLSGGGEVVILYYWDGVSDLVQDLDYVIWGDKCEGVDKTGVVVDGPDANFTGTQFQADTFVGTNSGANNGADATGQEVLNSFFSSHNSNNSWQRVDIAEGTEQTAGGNGVTGADETSENINTTWIEELPNPNTGPSANPTPFLVINEADAVAGTEFVEIFDGGNGNTNVDDATLVYYDGDSNTIVKVEQLSGTTDGNGYYVVNGALEDGADAVAIYYLNNNLMVGGSLTDTNLLDALVYDTDDADDPDLLALLRNDEPQVNENANGNANSVSMSRCSNGAGGQLRTSSFTLVPPSPGTANTCEPTDYYGDVTPSVLSDPDLLRSTLHNIIDDHNNGGYDNAWNILRDADADLTDPSGIRTVYSNETLTWLGGGNQAYNREHTWPQSYGFHGDNSGLGDNNPARTDAHHLMLSRVNYNSARGNRYYETCISSCVENTSDGNIRSVANHGVGGGPDHGDSNWQGPNNTFETWDFRKGDVARAMFYMDVRYEAGGPSDEVDLELTDNVGLIATGQRFMGRLSTLCQWHFSDPVDQIERDRNDVIADPSNQGNRNPFVDHPEWVSLVFQECLLTDEIPIFINGFE